MIRTICRSALVLGIFAAASVQSLSAADYCHSCRHGHSAYSGRSHFSGRTGPYGLPAGRTYYNGRYYGNFNNRFYGPQYGYF